MTVNTQDKVAPDIDAPRPQGVGLNEVVVRLHFVVHEHGEHAVCFDGVVDVQA